jgi:hypothetical protein
MNEEKRRMPKLDTIEKEVSFIDERLHAINTTYPPPTTPDYP